jgi:teichuronic acid biosynthesis glycosyltransferase TuaC
MIAGLPQGGAQLSNQQRDLHTLTLTPFYPTEQDDGQGCFVAEPLAALAEVGVHNTVFAVQPLYRPRLQPRDSAVPAEWLRHFALPGGLGLPTSGAFVFARIAGRARALHRSQPIDLIHAHAPLPCGHAAMLLSRELCVPYLVSVHGLDAFSTVQVRGKAGEWCRRVSQQVYRSASRVICISEHVRQQVLNGTDGNCRTTVVYNSADPTLFAPASSSAPVSSGLSVPLTILSIGNLIPIKGHELLIRAASSLASEFSSLRCEIIGDGPERHRLQALANELQVADRVRFLGRQSRSQVADALRCCTLFVLASRYEALGCVYLEAMSTGKPVIGCRGQGIAEVIRHGWNGFLVGPDDERELTLTIAMLLRDEPGRRKVSIAARETILGRFTLSQQAENLARVYRECVT